MKVQRLSDLGGVSVEGVDLAIPKTPEESRALKGLLDEHGLVVFRNQNLTKRQLVEAGAPFGGAMLNKVTVAPDPEAVGISVVSTRGVDGDVMPDDPDKLVGQADWHTDQGYLVQPNRGKILYAVQIPEEGGQTGFIDGQTTYATLPPDLREQIEGLHVIQSWRHSRREDDGGQQYRRNGAVELARDRFEDVVYPIVYPHPVTGANVLNYPPLWAAGILEMSGSAAEALHARIMAHIVQPKFQYWHKYSPGDAVMWDNWRFLHSAGGTPGRYARTLWSMAIVAGPILGLTTEQAAALKQNAA